MGKITGFLEIERQDRGYIKPELRIGNYKEYVTPLPQEALQGQAASGLIPEIQASCSTLSP